MFYHYIPFIFALCDLNCTQALTPVALAQAMKLLSHWFDGDTTPLRYEDIPTAVFCQPNIGTVGVTLEQALKKFPVDITFPDSNFCGMKHTITVENILTYMTLVVQTNTDKVLGTHMVG